MRKNLAAGVAGTQDLHQGLVGTRGTPGRKARWVPSTRKIQWIKRLSAKRVRRACDAEITEALQDADVVAYATAAVVRTGIPVFVKGKGRREIVREERAFTSPSTRSLFRFENAVDINRFLERKALARML